MYTHLPILTLSQSHEIIALLRRQTCSYTINSFNTKRVDRKWEQPCHLEGRAATVCVGFRQLIPFTTLSNPVNRHHVICRFNDDGKLYQRIIVVVVCRHIEEDIKRDKKK